MKKYYLIICMIFLAVGCASNYVVIDGHKYQLNKDGEIELTKTELERLKKSGATHIMEVAPEGGLAITPEQFALLQKDESLFNDWLQGKKKENANKGIAEHTYLFHEGGLKQSLTQYADEQGMKLSYKAKLNYYIESPVIIKGEQKIDVLVKLLEAYPLSVSIADKTITIVSI